MKITKKIRVTKAKVCDNCSMKKTCGDLPGLCIRLHHVLIASVVLVLLYFLMTMRV